MSNHYLKNGLPKTQCLVSPALILNCGNYEHFMGISSKSNSDISRTIKFVAAQLNTFGRHCLSLMIPEILPLYVMATAMPMLIVSSDDLDVNTPMKVGLEMFEYVKDYFACSLRCDYERVAQGNLDNGLIRKLNQFNTKGGLKFVFNVYMRELSYVGLNPCMELNLTVLSPHCLFVRSNKRNLLCELLRGDRVSSLINELLSQALLADITIQGARKLRGVLPLDMISFPFLQLREVR